MNKKEIIKKLKEAIKEIELTEKSELIAAYFKAIDPKYFDTTKYKKLTSDFEMFWRD